MRRLYVGRARRAFAVAAALAALGACGDGSGPSPSPDRVEVVSGSGQNVPAGTQPAQPLVARVLDEGGRPVQGAQVTFAASAQGDAVAPNPAVTDAQGLATATATLGAALGPHVFTATVAGVSAPAQFTVTRVAGPAASVQAVSGNGQSLAAGAQPQPLVARVVDAAGNPVAGAQVTFAASVQGDAVAPNPAVTDAQGQATAQPTVGAAPGPHVFTATVAGVAAGAQFTVTRSAGPAATVQVVSGNNQNLAPGAQPQPLVVRVVDAAGNPVPGAQVVFASSAQGDAFAPNPAVTDAQGQATTQWAPGAAAGTRAITASVAGAQAATFTARAGTLPAYLVIVSGNGQTGVRGRPLAAPLVVETRDATGAPVAGATVDWSAPENRFAPLVSTSDARGLASTVWTLPVLNTVPTQVAVARLQASGFTVNFTASAVRPAVASIAISPASIAVQCCDRSAAMHAVVRDDLGNPIPDAPLAWGLSADSLGVIRTSSDTSAAIQSAFPGTGTVFVSSGGMSASAPLTVTPAAAGPVLQVYDPFFTRSFGGTLFFVRASNGLINPAAFELKVRNAGGSGTIAGITTTVEYIGGDAGWLRTTLSSATAPALLRLTVDPAVTVTRLSLARVTVSSTTPGTTPVTYTVQYAP